jgi:hypothetical protein
MTLFDTSSSLTGAKEERNIEGNFRARDIDLGGGIVPVTIIQGFKGSLFLSLHYKVSLSRDFNLKVLRYPLLFPIFGNIFEC